MTPSPEFPLDAQALSWSLSDPEQRLGFSGGRYTRVNYLMSALVAIPLSLMFLFVLYPFRETGLPKMFFRPGNVVIVLTITFLTVWSLVILTLKSLKLRLQRQALQLAVIPVDADFHLSPQTVRRVDDRISHLVDDARAFLLIHRITLGLSNLKNIGRVGDVAEIFKTQADYDEAGVETSYLLVSVFVWAIPVLGFIGTVLGLSVAIGNFGGVLQSASEIEKIKDNLQAVTGGLATAFETTLIGLVAALLVQLLVVWCKQAELEFLDECSDYCSRHIVSRLRLLPLEEAN